MLTQAQADELLYEHIGQIIATSNLQATILGVYNPPSDTKDTHERVKIESDVIYKKTVDEIMKHVRIRLDFERSYQAAISSGMVEF